MTRSTSNDAASDRSAFEGFNMEPELLMNILSNSLNDLFAPPPAPFITDFPNFQFTNFGDEPHPEHSFDPFASDTLFDRFLNNFPSADIFDMI
jgi:hypothetical protein